MLQIAIIKIVTSAYTAYFQAWTDQSPQVYPLYFTWLQNQLKISTNSDNNFKIVLKILEYLETNSR